MTQESVPTGMFHRVAAEPGAPKWAACIKRQRPLYVREHDVRSPFDRDYDRILHSQAYSRLKQKTQLFFAPQDDHVCTRIEHVAHVESVSHTIAKVLGLNAELTRAIATGHDLGHAPFGHLGEEILRDLAKQSHLPFWHERNGLRFVDSLELLENPTGGFEPLNLTYAVRDGIISHCGEVDQNGLKPRDEAIDLADYEKPNAYAPYTWEGCVVKFSDKIAYLGRDIQDAILLNILTQADLKVLEEEAKDAFGLSLGKINSTVLIRKFVHDLCLMSSPEKGICLSKPVFEFMRRLRSHNYERICRHERLTAFHDYAQLVLESLYKALIKAYWDEKTGEALGELERIYPRLVAPFRAWLSKYWDLTDRGLRPELQNPVVYRIREEGERAYALAVIDYIAGMTDGYAMRCFEALVHF